MYISTKMCIFILFMAYAIEIGGVQKRNIGLKVLAKEGKANATIGEDFTIRCKSSVKTPDIKWVRNGTITAIIMTNICDPSLDSTRKYNYSCDNVNQSFDLKIPGDRMTEEEHNTMWSCHDSFSNKSNKFPLYVNVPINSLDIFFHQGINNDNTSILNLSCITSACRPEVRVEWYIKNEVSTRMLDGNTRIENMGNRFKTITNLKMERPEFNAGDSVYCSANNSHPNYQLASNSFFIPPFENELTKKHINNSKMEVDRNDSIILMCDESTTLDIIHVANNRASTRIGSTVALKYENTLLQEISCVDAGIYVCESGIRNITTHLFVYCKPEILNKSESTVFTRQGNKLILFINFTSYPSSRVTWIFNQEGKTEELIVGSQYGFSVQQANETFTAMSIMIKVNFSTDDFGEYTVKLENKLGNETETFKVLSEDNNQHYSGYGLLALPVSLILIILVVVVLMFIARLKRQKGSKAMKTTHPISPVPQGYDGSYRDNVLYVPTDPEFLAHVHHSGNTNNGRPEMQTINRPEVLTHPDNTETGDAHEPMPIPRKKKKSKTMHKNQHNQPVNRQQSERHSAVSELHYQGVTEENDDGPPIPPRDY